ncbi:probable ATP-dependent RNA helicase DDX20 [Colossoma macropomum]|uniref:probable ATP-dependent RNA helicase DDX20 n=1 Tax=Colossoma macropomum TaxID=42526 RepID=UPI001864152D|nr:probable ATP-dependent RNA helicase DDX20 [Colossoma macropomum]
MAASMRQAAHQIDTRTRTDDVLLSDGVEFSSLLLSKPVLEGLSASGFQRPSPIQLKAIPLGRCGLDLIVQAKSGTGKTCVFATIALDSLVLENAATQVLVLAPTREIAVQIHAVVMAIGSAMEGLECHVFIGGRPVSQDKLHLKKCHIAIGSPGRIKQLIEMGLLLTASIRLFVLDEADKLLEEGSFQEQINWIFSSLPVNKQMLALSATYPESLAQHLCRYMREPTFVRLNPTDPGLIGLKQYYKLVHSHALPHKVFEEKVQNLLELFSKIPFNQALVFSNLHTRAQHLADVLSSKGLPSVCISGSLSQEQRLEAMSKLKQYQCRVLISTDLTSRGIDAEKVNLVINLDVPQDWETYMHRIGRAGRFGTLGIAVTYCCHGEEENKMMAIAQKCSLHLNQLPDPIPAGLMEEQCDWDITVQPPSKSDLSFSVEPKVDRKKRATSEPAASKTSKQAQRTLSTKDQPEHHSPAKTQPPSSDRKKSKKPAVGTEASVASPKAGAPDPNVEPSSALTRQEMQDALPKIPPLPSFKPPAQRPMSFAEAVADFENFMTNGPGRSVEIIRLYGARDERTTTVNGQYKNHVAEVEPYPQDEKHGLLDGITCPSQRSVDSTSCRMPSSLTSDSSSSSGSESEMETEQKTDASASSSLSSAPQKQNSYRQPQLHSAPKHITEPSPSKASTAKQPVKSRPNQAKPQVKTHHPHYQSQAVHNQRLKSGPEKKRAGKAAKADVARWKKDTGRQEDEEEEYSEEEEEDEQDYWRAYYRAWQEYYSPAYYYHSPYNWLAAYRMNTVYMMEMMKH